MKQTESYLLLKAKLTFINKPEDTVEINQQCNRKKSVVRRYLRKKYAAKNVYLIFKTYALEGVTR